MLPLLPQHEFGDGDVVNPVFTSQFHLCDTTGCVTASDGTDIILGQFGPRARRSFQNALRIYVRRILVAADIATVAAIKLCAPFLDHVVGVVFVGAQEQVARSNTGRRVAMVTDAHSVRDRPKVDFPRYATSRLSFPVIACSPL